MKITHEQLKSSYKSHIRRQVPSSRQGCPSPELILRAFEASTSSEDKEKVVNHMAGCSHCLQEFELWLSFFREQDKALRDITGWTKPEGKEAIVQGQKPKILESGLGPRVQKRPSWRWAFGLILFAAIASLLFVGIRKFFVNSRLEERGRLPGQIRLITPVQGQKVQIPFVFRWEGIPGAEGYNLEVFDRTLLLLWKSPRIDARRYELPPEAQPLIKKAGGYFWTITAWLKDGMKRESPLEEFTVDR